MTRYVLAIYIVLFVSSCTVPKYLTTTDVYYKTTTNTFNYGAQNIDNNAQIDNGSLTCHYKGFDIQYTLENNFIISFTIINNNNKSLLIDKSKCFVLYDGYSTELFKDVRSSRSTTFNNVQDAVNNVQTNEASVLMTIPPYSKWQLPIIESNVRAVKKMPTFATTHIGTTAISQYSDQEITEFVIPYSYDYSMAEWKTCRNRIFVNSVTCYNENTLNDETNLEPVWVSTNQYILKNSIEPDWTEANRIDAINVKKYKKHNSAVKASRIFWGAVLLAPTCLIAPMFLWTDPGCDNSDHEPHLYGKKKNLYDYLWH